MESLTLQTIINQYVQLQPPNPKGWQAVQCNVCHDHTRKGLRGAFKFDDGKTIYKCWNCGHLSIYDPDENEYMTDKMMKTLNAFNIPESEWQPLILSSKAYATGGKKRTKEKVETADIEPNELKMPSIFYYLKDAKPDDYVADVAREYLTSRDVDPESYPFMLARKAENKILHKWVGRVIMPIYKNNKLIYYTGRALYDAKLKYETPAQPKEKILYGFDLLFDHSDMPLFVNEGWFDAYAINGVATLGNVITSAQVQWLNRSPKEKIYIPDKFGDGINAALQALDEGWYISTPDIGSTCKDMSDAVKKYGKLYVIKSIIDNKVKRDDDSTAEVQLKNYCDS